MTLQEIKDKIIVLDCGGQYTHLICRRVRDLGTYSEIQSYNVNLNTLKEINPKGIIVSGGPGSVHEAGQLLSELSATYTTDGFTVFKAKNVSEMTNVYASATAPTSGKNGVLRENSSKREGQNIT